MQSFNFDNFKMFFYFEVTSVILLAAIDGISLKGFGMEAILAKTCGPVCSQIVIWYQCGVGAVF